MSADLQRLKAAIRRIALTPDERRQLLGDGQNKGGKPGAAGVGTSEAAESRLCCDGSTGSANPGTGERDPDADGAGQDGLDSSDPANLESGDGTLSGVTDCATGAPVCFDGAGFIPPEGWDEPGDPPIDPTYDSSVYYRGIITFDERDESDDYITTQEFFQLCSEAKSWVQSFCPYISPNENCSGGGQAGQDCALEYGVIGHSIAPLDCALQPNPICDEPPPLAESWPSDGCTNLIIKDGAIVGSKYDPDQDGSYSAPRDSIDLCDPENGARITLRASGQSDWKTIDAINGGDGYLYSGGKQIARVSGDEFTDPNV